MLRVLSIIAFVACSSSSRTQQRLQAGDIAFVGATVVPMNRQGTLTNHTVVVRGDKIALVAPASSIDTKGAQVLDVRGKWLVPGLADMHVHSWSERDFPLYVLNGVTTIRDLFGSPKHLEWRTSLAAGKLLGPTLFAAGPIVDGDPPTWPGSAVVTTVEQARTVVREQRQAGYDLIKVYNDLGADIYDAIVAEAKAQGIPFGGHVPAAVGLDKALAAGQRTIEHLDGYLPWRGEARVDPKTIAATAKAEVWNCPTLVVTDRMGRLDNPASLESTRGLAYVAQAVRAMWKPENDFRLRSWTPAVFEGTRARQVKAKQLVADLHKAGAKLVLGTDTGNPFVVPGFAVHDELALLVSAGLTPWHARRMATVAPAELVGAPGSFGVIAPGARADLIVVAGDPLANIAALAEPSHVVLRGKLHERAALLAEIEKKPTDPFASLPPIDVEGTKVAAPRYDVTMNEGPIGKERAVISKLADGTRVIRGQAVYDMPSLQLLYRATPDAVEFTNGPKVTRAGKNVILKLPTKEMEHTTTADAVIAPQTIAEFVWYAGRLATIEVGVSQTITAAAIIVENEVRIDPASYTFKRLPDVDGRRVYAATGKVGRLDVKGSFSTDADGIPHEIELTVSFGTIKMKRVE